MFDAPSLRGYNFFFKVGHARDPAYAHVDLILRFLLVYPVSNLPTKFEVSSFNRSRDMEKVPKFHKVGDVTPLRSLLS